MQPQLEYLKAVIEGAPGIESWKTWFDRNDVELQRGLSRTKYLDLKLNRIKAIPAILEAQRIKFVPSERYAYLGGIEGHCRDCGAALEHSSNFEKAGGLIWCPNGCFRMHVLVRPDL